MAKVVPFIVITKLNGHFFEKTCAMVKSVQIG